jgi:hypothetical protein
VFTTFSHTWVDGIGIKDAERVSKREKLAVDPAFNATLTILPVLQAMEP